MPSFKITEHKFDIVIIGAGGAGLMAAVRAAQKGLSTACISKVDPTRSHTVAAKGGINAALGNIDKDDWRWHMYDTICGGDWLSDQDAVEYMCKNAASTIIELEQMGVPFSRLDNGKIYQRIYGGQSSEFGKGAPPHRACAVADRTGHSILHTLHQQALKHNADFFTHHFAIELIMDEGQCRGVVTWDMENGRICIFRAHMVILATGGYGQTYRTNTSSSICTGDGNAMVLRAGLALQDMEFIQFHPTGLYGSGFLITEAARGEGAYLINGLGERFMERYAPHYKDLAARDIIARAMAVEILEGRGAGEKKDHLLLCLSHLDPEIIRKKLPTVHENALKFARVDAENAPIPVVPSVHYTMGGIPTNKFCEVIAQNESIVPGLMAIGETACVSVHGANRLGCNSLLDIIVFGKLAVERAAEIIEPGQKHKTIEKAESKSLEYINRLANNKGENQTAFLRNKMQVIMAEYAGVFRNEKLLETGIYNMYQLIDRINRIKITNDSLVWNNELLDAMELSNLSLQALVTLESASFRTESRGSHFRDDYPSRNDKKWLKHSISWLVDNKVEISTRKVRINDYSKQLAELTPKKREY